MLFYMSLAHCWGQQWTLIPSAAKANDRHHHVALRIFGSSLVRLPISDDDIRGIVRALVTGISGIARATSIATGGAAEGAATTRISIYIYIM